MYYCPRKMKNKKGVGQGVRLREVCSKVRGVRPREVCSKVREVRIKEMRSKVRKKAEK